jgi:predicted RNA-binding Zn-ribbon protein involved in translation (DUF1610 family)
MQNDPMEEWRRLTALYSEMGEIEIQDLADQINDLTPAAQQVLRDELKKRGISGVSDTKKPADSSAAVHIEPSSYRYQFSELPAEDEGSRDYTWKTPLCECETNEQVSQLAEALRRAGIDSWVDKPTSKFFSYNPRISVAADQLDQARLIAAQPIPQDIIDAMKADSEEPETVPEFSCPKCGAKDPTLESVDPSNEWLCESCGHAWSDPLPDSST